MTPDQATELAGLLRDAARRDEPIAKAVVKLVQLSYEAAKESLVSTDGEDMLRKQGAARAFKRLYNDLTVAPPSIQQES